MSETPEQKRKRHIEDGERYISFVTRHWKDPKLSAVELAGQMLEDRAKEIAMTFASPKPKDAEGIGRWIEEMPKSNAQVRKRERAVRLAGKAKEYGISTNAEELLEIATLGAGKWSLALALGKANGEPAADKSL